MHNASAFGSLKICCHIFLTPLPYDAFDTYSAHKAGTLVKDYQNISRCCQPISETVALPYTSTFSALTPLSVSRFKVALPVFQCHMEARGTPITNKDDDNIMFALKETKLTNNVIVN